MKVSTEIASLSTPPGPPVVIASDNDTPRGCVVVCIGEATATVRAAELSSAAQKARK